MDEPSGVRIELRARRVSVDGESVNLTPLEWRLLVTLVRNKGEVLSPETLLELAWDDPAGTNPERVKFAVLRQRRKLGRAGERIETVRGFGYRF